MESNLVKIGALWEKENRETGQVFFAGKMGDADLMIFKNKHKKEAKHPDYIVYVKTPQRQEGKKEDGPQFDKNDQIPF